MSKNPIKIALTQLVLILSMGLLILLYIDRSEKEVLPLQRELVGLAPVHATVKFEVELVSQQPAKDKETVVKDWSQLRSLYLSSFKNHALKWDRTDVSNVDEAIARYDLHTKKSFTALLLSLNQVIYSLSDRNDLVLDSNLTRYHLIELLTRFIPNAVYSAALDGDRPIDISDLGRVQHSLNIPGIPPDVKKCGLRLLDARSKKETIRILYELNDELERAIRDLLQRQIQQNRTLEGISVLVGVVALLISVLLSRMLMPEPYSIIDPEGQGQRALRIMSLLVIFGGTLAILIWSQVIPRWPYFFYICGGMIGFSVARQPRKIPLYVSWIGIFSLCAIVSFGASYSTIQQLKTAFGSQPFFALKILPIVLAFIAPPPMSLTTIVIIFAGLTPIIEYFALIPIELRSALPAGEPWAGIIYTGIGLGIFRARIRETTLQQDLTRTIVEKEGTQKLLRSESRFRRISESNLLGVVHSTTAGNVIDANQYFLDLVGYSLDDFHKLDLRLVEITAPEFRDVHVRYNREVVAHGSAPPYEKVYIRKDGRRVWALVGAALLEGTQDELITIVLDITDRKAVLREREELLVQAQKTIQLRDNFISVVSHELRTPLTPLKIMIHLISNLIGANHSENPHSAQILEAVKNGRHQVRRLERLVEAMLAAVNLNTGELLLNRSDCDFASLVRTVVDRLSEAIRKANCRLVLNLTDGLKVNCDSERVMQAIENILENAIKFGPNAPIEVSLVNTNGSACLTIRDYGIGFPFNKQENVFNRFQRNVPVESYGGLGLGLYIAQSIIEAHQGKIYGESGPDRGAIFTIELPVVQEINS